MVNVKRLVNYRADMPLVILAVACIVSIVAFAGYYYYDRYVHPNERLTDRQARHFEDMVEKDPQNANLRVSTAGYYLQSGLVESAIQQGEQALIIAPKHLGALYVLGQAYTEKGETDKAIAAFEQIIELNKDNPMARIDKNLEAAYYQLGNLYNAQGRTPEAIVALKKALEIDKADADAHYLLGVAFQNQKDDASAVDEFQAGLRFDPYFVEAYKGLASSYAALGKPDESSWAQAMVLFSQGKYSESATGLEKVVAQAPTLTQAYLGLGLAYEKLSQREKAISALHQYQKAHPDELVVEQALGRLSRDVKP
jgi:tetratricopeptide (TPR) repeat protein